MPKLQQIHAQRLSAIEEDCVGSEGQQRTVVSEEEEKEEKKKKKEGVSVYDRNAGAILTYHTVSHSRIRKSSLLNALLIKAHDFKQF
jgi:hypothetical protein